MKIILTSIQQQRVITCLQAANPTQAIVQALVKAGGTVFLVGGAVRDLVLREQAVVPDLDIEVHGLTLEQLEKELARFGTVIAIGKAFGVLRVLGLDVDWSLPRIDASGRKPQVDVQKDLPIERALRRRDLTMNALALDLTTFELHDPFGGVRDFQEKILRAPDAQLFIEDPLRFYRVMQFVGRFEMEPDPELTQLCRTMSLVDVSRERIEMEFTKLFLKSRRPSLGLRWLDSLGRMTEILPEIALLHGVQQSPQWHPEGDVFEHTMQAVDAAAALGYESEEEKLLVLYAALAHDCGKALTTTFQDGRWRSFGHEIEGIPNAKHVIERICLTKRSVETVCRLVRYHMAPGVLVRDGGSPAAFKRLAFNLAPVANIYLLAQLGFADKRGRNGQGHEPLSTRLEDIEEFCEYAKKYGVFMGPEAPVLTGADFLDVLTPGPLVGDAVQQAYKIQINKGVVDKQELKQRVLDGFKAEDKSHKREGEE